MASLAELGEISKGLPSALRAKRIKQGFDYEGVSEPVIRRMEAHLRGKVYGGNSMGFDKKVSEHYRNNPTMLNEARSQRRASRSVFGHEHVQPKSIGEMTPEERASRLGQLRYQRQQRGLPPLTRQEEKTVSTRLDKKPLFIGGGVALTGLAGGTYAYNRRRKETAP